MENSIDYNLNFIENIYINSEGYEFERNKIMNKIDKYFTKNSKEYDYLFNTVPIIYSSVLIFGITSFICNLFSLI